MHFHILLVAAFDITTFDMVSNVQEMVSKSHCTIALLVVLVVPLCHSYNILFATIYGTMSHVITMTPTIEALSALGHNITFLTFKAPMLNATIADKVTVVLLEDTGPHLDKLLPNYYVLQNLSSSELYKTARALVVDSYDVFLNDPGFRHMVTKAKRKSVTYDLIVMDVCMCEWAMPLVWLLGSPPFILYSTAGLFSWIANALDIPTPFAYVPIHTQSLSDHMTFAQRLFNAFQHLLEWTIGRFVMLPDLKAKTLKMFPEISPVFDIRMNASFVFTNTYTPAVDFPKPSAPFHKEVGGVHLRPAQALPTDLEDFIQGPGSDGFVYLSFGTFMKGEEMPAKMLEAFLATFRRLPQQVVWVFNGNITDLPRNVLLQKWAPQQDLLGHKNIRLFITHCGQLSFHEAVYHGVPMVGMPFLNDQLINTRFLVERGLGESLDAFSSNYMDDVYKAVTNVLTIPRYKKRVLHYSARIRDRPMKALDTTLYWIQYVARHRGGLHMRFHSSQLFPHQQLLLDVMGSTLLAFIILVFGLRKLWKLIACWKSRSNMPIADIIINEEKAELV